jgi:hypothetical protein
MKVAAQPGDPLLAALRDPAALPALPLPAWERLVAVARRNAVLAYLAQRIEADGLLDAIPPQPRSALVSARIAARRYAQLARWELDQLARVLLPLGIPIIALKGAAYVLRRMPHADTRLLADVDIMVPRARIDEAEAALLHAGWEGTKLHPYDQRYYREWSHELPPLHFPGRRIGVDVHHTICPPVSRLRPDPQAFWSRATPAGDAGVLVLAPPDAFLHAAVHLFFDSDFDGRFRDLVDLHEMAQRFGADPAFWPDVVARAQQLGLGRPLHYTLAMLARILATPVPRDVAAATLAYAASAPVDATMMRMLDAVLRPVDPQAWPRPHRLTLWLLYVRSHWLRMPAHLLVPHLLRKSLRRAAPAADGAPEPAAR